MFLLMLLKDWSEMDLQTKSGHRARVQGYMLPMEGGGRIQATAFMPVFSTYEQAEAAQGTSGAPFYEVDRIENCDDFEPYTPDGDGPQLI